MKRHGHKLIWGLLLLLLLVGINVAAELLGTGRGSRETPYISKKAAAAHGLVLAVDSVQIIPPEEATRLARQNYGSLAIPSPVPVTRVVYTYSMLDQSSQPVRVYARAYIPRQAVSSLLVIAPGTTGIGDACSPSLEQPQARNWADYESHALAYASRGYMVVVPDYEGQRDPSRIHHYMSGLLEGRAVLDSLAAGRQLPQASRLSPSPSLFVSGYSQGGHAAYWADKISGSYAPKTKLDGIIGWGPVMDVKQTWQDITKGANIVWFGPYVLLSYGDLYKENYNLDRILQQRWIQNLPADVSAHCIDTNIAFWGSRPQAVYTPEFLDNLKKGSLPRGLYGALDADLEANIAGDAKTASAKLINQGSLDNVVLPSQQEKAKSRLCTNSKGPAAIIFYPRSNHYTTMRDSFNDTLSWMSKVSGRQPLPNSCR